MFKRTVVPLCAPIHSHDKTKPLSDLRDMNKKNKKSSAAAVFPNSDSANLQIVSGTVTQTVPLYI